MDHPGFEAVSYQGDYLVGDVLGGVPAASFEPGVPLHIILADGKRLPATTAGRHGDDAQRQVLIELGEPAQLELPAAVVFDLPDFQVDGEMIRMRAADDLAGCASILASLAELSAQTPPGDVYGVFTRAEEVGLMGARLLAESGLLSKETLVVSLESSRTLPGAEQGSGPVIRVGDAGMTFNADAESVLLKARETLQLQEGGFRVQRQLMSGGVCEASAFALFGYRTTGIAFPLGNYHNGAPDGTIQAEYIHVEDFLGGVRLIVEAARQMPEKNNIAFKQRLSHVPDDVRERLGRKLA
jgi:endoglucanase